MIIYVNGDFLPEQEAKVSGYDHGFLYGDGVFELDERVGRSHESAQSIMFVCALSMNRA